MLDIGWTEIAIIVVMAIIVIGPKDLPKAMHTVAKMIGKAKAMIREFQGSLDEMIKENELEEVKNQIQSARKFNVKSQITQAIDTDGELEKAMDFTKEKEAINKSLRDDDKVELPSTDLENAGEIEKVEKPAEEKSNKTESPKT